MTSAKPNKVVLWSPHNATQFVVASQTMRLYMASADQDSASSDTLGFQQLPPPLQSPAFISSGAGLVASAAGKPVSASPSALQDQGADEYKEAKYDGSPASLDEGARPLLTQLLTPTDCVCIQTRCRLPGAASRSSCWILSRISNNPSRFARVSVGCCVRSLEAWRAAVPVVDA